MLTAEDEILLPPLDLRRSALLFDIDGTLLDIAATPEAVEVPKALVEAIGVLSERTAGAVAFVSGRTLGSIDRLFRPLTLPAIGCHGAELRTVPDGTIRTGTWLPPDLKSWIGELAATAPGAMVEDKGLAIAIHYRLAPDAEPLLLRALMERHAWFVANDLQILRGKAVIDIKSRLFNKGTALRRLMRDRPFAFRQPVFLGDDTTDEDVFRVLPDFAGLGFSVGRRIEGAAHTFPSPQAVREWIVRLASGGIS